MPKPPGSRDIAGEIKALQKRVDELSRRGNSAAPIVVNLNADVGMPNVLHNVVPVISWKPTAESDPYGAYHYNEGGDTWVEIPFAGRWYIRLHSRFRAAQAWDGNNPSAVAGIVTSNGVDIGEQASIHPPHVNVTLNTIVEDRLFEKGDKIRFRFWSRYGGSTTLLSNITGAYTHYVLRYLGPN